MLLQASALFTSQYYVSYVFGVSFLRVTISCVTTTWQQHNTRTQESIANHVHTYYYKIKWLRKPNSFQAIVYKSTPFEPVLHSLLLIKLLNDTGNWKISEIFFWNFASRKPRKLGFINKLHLDIFRGTETWFNWKCWFNGSLTSRNLICL